eukprot:TRINITY_DN37856_c0_g4_i1.p4 TRINITY_DN37856_c0_g4~~TRINITY_DN37856_c0_g4_i1.p4  ORF type:complete len:146 (+),score=8.23 TRINITY_DN37856_c0_g4_i1:40-477(+)
MWCAPDMMNCAVTHMDFDLVHRSFEHLQPGWISAGTSDAVWPIAPRNAHLSTDPPTRTLPIITNAPRTSPPSTTLTRTQYIPSLVGTRVCKICRTGGIVRCSLGRRLPPSDSSILVMGGMSIIFIICIVSSITTDAGTAGKCDGI